MGDYSLAYLAYIIGIIISAVIFGIVTQHINASKGYDGGFAWGFWLGIIGIIVVACKPDNVRHYYIGSESAHFHEKNILNDGGWRCNSCGKVNPSYQTTCICGVAMKDNNKVNREKEKAKASSADELKKYKDLLDSGAITQEEYDQMKKKLLGI